MRSQSEVTTIAIVENLQIAKHFHHCLICTSNQSNDHQQNLGRRLRQDDNIHLCQVGILQHQCKLQYNCSSASSIVSSSASSSALVEALVQAQCNYFSACSLASSGRGGASKHCVWAQPALRVLVTNCSQTTASILVISIPRSSASILVISISRSPQSSTSSQW